MISTAGDRPSRLWQTVYSTSVFDSVGDAAPSQIVRGQLNSHPISWQNLNKVFADFAGYMRQDLVPAIQLDSKHCVGEGFFNGAFKFDHALFWHQTTSPGRFVRISGPPSVIKSECSKCAEGL